MLSLLSVFESTQPTSCQIRKSKNHLVNPKERDIYYEVKKAWKEVCLWVFFPSFLL